MHLVENVAKYLEDLLRDVIGFGFISSLVDVRKSLKRPQNYEDYYHLKCIEEEGSGHRVSVECVRGLLVLDF